MRKVIAYLLYLPILGGLGYQIAICAVLLMHGFPAGLFGLLYTAVFVWLARRAFAIYNGPADAPGLWKDMAVMGVIDTMLAVMLFERFL